MLKRFWVIVLAVGLVWPILSTQAASPLPSALAYLQNNYPSQSSANQDWAAIALGENGVAVTPAATDTSTLLGIERSTIAQTAQGTDATSAVSQVESGFTTDQFGSPTLINDDIFGALAVAGADPTWLATHQSVFTTIANSQRSDGSFGFSKNGGGDGDITAAAIWALELASNKPAVALNSAINFLQQCQNPDGGYGALPGENSNVATSSWAMIAQTALSQDSSKVRDYLLSQEQSGGYWLQGGNANYLNTAYAVMALSGQKLPYKKPVPVTNGNLNTSPVTPIAKPGTTSQPAAKNQPSATPKNTASPATNSTPGRSSTKKPIKKVVRRIVRTTTVTTYQTVSCSASASASAGDSYATASALASCQ